MGSGVSDGSRQDSGRGMECQKGRLKIRKPVFRRPLNSFVRCANG
ncbi:hypothetical protein NEIMUCOT_04110 [Neisseria mucosa ATCC 25996]|uniref:Uncharacterized protein n=2 Tax=Neisseriaceae TaxID=481 RepID=D2ZU23_NEIM2|nr:hypothetical protein NEIMUCOT_04110 [Neisseria mucosa ATCC 25996]KIC06916.1 hypothetical protein MCC93_17070 [Morococcus cerebrosus]